jgi:ribose transport system permease protein
MSADHPTTRPWRRQLGPRNISAVYLLILEILFAVVMIPHLFLQESTLVAILNNGTVVALVAVALTLPLATGVYDLSVGATLAFAGVVAGWLQVQHGVPLPLALLAAVATGAVVGAINAFLVVRLRINSLIATLGMSTILLGLTSGVSGNQQIAGLSAGFLKLAGAQFLGLSLGAYYLAALALALYFALEHTPAGRYLYATGGNAEAARLAGVATGRYVSLSLILCSTIAAFAGILQASIIGLASKDIGPQFLLPAFAAAFLGATQFKGGRFNVWGTVLAVYTLATGVKVLQLWTQKFWLDDIFHGVVLIVAVGIASYEGSVRLGNWRRRAEVRAETRAEDGSARGDLLARR